MKKYLLLVVFFFSLLPSFAQEPVDFEKYKPTPLISEIEIFAGPSISFLRGGADVISYSSSPRSLKLGYTAGIGLTHLVNKKIELKALIFYENKGG